MIEVNERARFWSGFGTGAICALLIAIFVFPLFKQPESVPEVVTEPSALKGAEQLRALQIRSLTAQLEAARFRKLQELLSNPEALRLTRAEYAEVANQKMFEDFEDRWMYYEDPEMEDIEDFVESREFEDWLNEYLNNMDQDEYGPGW